MKHVIVIVEDEPAVVDSLKMLLGDYDVISVNTLHDALAVFKTLDPDAVILDLGLPDSVSKANTIIQVEEAVDAPVIIYTGSPEDVEAGKATTLAVVKGCPADVLLETIKDAAIRHRIHKIYRPFQAHLDEARSILAGMKQALGEEGPCG